MGDRHLYEDDEYWENSDPLFMLKACGISLAFVMFIIVPWIVGASQLIRWIFF